jgi:3-hydroxyisobutyrate dehydrogenase-like beta-hydroxyacid dehydrogenase
LTATYAVLGTGLMGAAVAKTLAATGHDVVAWNRTHARAVPLADHDVRVFEDVIGTLDQADVISVVLLDHDAAIEALNPHLAVLSGKTVINLMTGTPSQAEELAALMNDVGADYLDGAIECYPSDIGTADALINVSGSATAWTNHAEALKRIAGRAKFVGELPGAANLLDTAMAGAFHVVSMGALCEALAFLQSAGVDITGPGIDLDYWLELGRDEAHKLIETLGSKDFATQEATLSVYLAGTTQWLQTMYAAGQRAPLMTALVNNLALTVAAGRGELGFAAQAETASCR